MTDPATMPTTGSIGRLGGGVSGTHPKLPSALAGGGPDGGSSAKQHAPWPRDDTPGGRRSLGAVLIQSTI
ncbi:MAG: hypothetical protein ACREJT_13730, partial [Myxococcota bacterium]